MNMIHPLNIKNVYFYTLPTVKITKAIVMQKVAQGKNTIYLLLLHSHTITNVVSIYSFHVITNILFFIVAILLLNRPIVNNYPHPLSNVTNKIIMINHAIYII